MNRREGLSSMAPSQVTPEGSMFLQHLDVSLARLLLCEALSLGARDFFALKCLGTFYLKTYPERKAVLMPWRLRTDLRSRKLPFYWRERGLFFRPTGKRDSGSVPRNCILIKPFDGKLSETVEN